MHSSRMRTAHALLYRWGSLSRGSPWQRPPWTETPRPWTQTPLGMWPVVHAGTEIPPLWIEWHTGVKKHYLATTSLRAVKIIQWQKGISVECQVPDCWQYDMTYIVNKFAHVWWVRVPGPSTGTHHPSPLVDRQTQKTAALFVGGKINLTLLTHIRILDSFKHLKLATWSSLNHIFTLDTIDFCDIFHRTVKVGYQFLDFVNKKMHILRILLSKKVNNSLQSANPA